MVLVELIRLVIVLALTAAGYQMGKLAPGRFQPGTIAPETSPLLFSVFGAGLGYVVGGMVGRSLLSGIGAVERRAERISGGAIVSGSLGFLAGALASVFPAWIILTLVPIEWLSYPSVVLTFIVLTYAGSRVAARKRFDLLGMMGLSQPRSFRGAAAEATAGAKVLDTSAIIDGRIIEVARSGFLTGHVVCPRFVLEEIQSIADSSDATRRSRGRRGLETLDVLQGDPRVRLEVTDDELPGIAEVDAKLVALARRIGGVLVTTDFNLHRVAELQGVPVLNINTLAASLRPVVLPGEEVFVRIIREGSQKGQGVGYLDDGTMVVVEEAGSLVGREVQATVTSVLQTAAGRMLFSTPVDRVAPARDE